MKRNRNYKKNDNKIWEILNGKEIVALRDLLYKVWFVQFGFWKFVFADNWNLEITFSISWNLLFLQTFMPTMGNHSPP